MASGGTASVIFMVFSSRGPLTEDRLMAMIRPPTERFFKEPWKSVFASVPVTLVRPLEPDAGPVERVIKDGPYANDFPVDPETRYLIGLKWAVNDRPGLNRREAQLAIRTHAWPLLERQGITGTLQFSLDQYGIPLPGDRGWPGGPGYPSIVVSSPSGPPADRFRGRGGLLGLMFGVFMVAGATIVDRNRQRRRRFALTGHEEDRDDLDMMRELIELYVQDAEMYAQAGENEKSCRACKDALNTYQERQKLMRRTVVGRYAQSE
jgi:hypothetical protein